MTGFWICIIVILAINGAIAVYYSRNIPLVGEDDDAPADR